MKELAKALEKPNSYDEEDYKTIIYEAICAVDRENSTHLNADGVGREQIRDRLCTLKKTELYNQLKYPKETKYKLIELLSEKTDPGSNSKKKGGTNRSFASKFCHYACFFIFENEPEQDNYSIYDSVVKRALKEYLIHFNCDRFTDASLDDYPTYIEAIDVVRSHADDSISRNGFDHLLWYYFKDQSKKEANS